MFTFQEYMTALKLQCGGLHNLIWFGVVVKEGAVPSSVCRATGTTKHNTGWCEDCTAQSRFQDPAMLHSSVALCAAAIWPTRGRNLHSGILFLQQEQKETEMLLQRKLQLEQQVEADRLRVAELTRQALSRSSATAAATRKSTCGSTLVKLFEHTCSGPKELLTSKVENRCFSFARTWGWGWQINRNVFEPIRDGSATLQVGLQ